VILFYLCHYITLYTSEVIMAGNMCKYTTFCGPGSSVGIATGFELDDPGIEIQFASDSEGERLQAFASVESVVY
jgi:hypothetical protein